MGNLKLVWLRDEDRGEVSKKEQLEVLEETEEHTENK